MNETQQFESNNQDEAPVEKRRAWRSRRVLIPAVAVIAVLGAGGSVWASSGGSDGGDLSGNQRTKASQAAIEAAGGGTVTEAEEEDGGYEVDVTLDDGTELEVRLDKSYKVVETETEGPEDDRPLTAAETTAATKAALAEIGSGAVTEVERESDGYEVDVTKADDTEWSVQLDKKYAVVSSNRDD